MIRLLPIVIGMIGALLQSADALPQSAKAAQQSDHLLFALDRWVARGDAMKALMMPDGYDLENAPGKENGDWSIQGEVDVEATPYLALMIPQISRESSWSLTLTDPAQHLLHKSAPSFGLFVYDLRKTPGWQSRTRCRIHLGVQGPAGRDNGLIIAWMGLFHTPPGPPNPAGEMQTLQQADRMNRAQALYTPEEVALSLINDPAPEWAWGGAISHASVDTDRFPFVEVDVRALSSGGNWRIGVPSVTNGPENRQAGVVAMNYRDQLTQGGVRDLETQLILGGAGARIRYAPIRFTPYPSLSRSLVERTDRAVPESRPVENTLTTSSFTLQYEPGAGLFRIRRKEGAASLATRFLEMNGLDLTPPGPLMLDHEKGAGGERLTFKRHAGGVDFEVRIEAPADAPGLLHWRVFATPTSAAHLASCGHEVCYAAASGSKAELRRIANQSWSASGLAYLVAPGLGTALYFQDFTALNPLFAKCHIPPRFLVHASGRTFGFANPMDTRAVFPAGKTVLLSDAWLALSPEEPKDRLADADLFLQEQAAVYTHLTDRPATQQRDWQKLARLALRDLYSPFCWSGWENKVYLQPYVGLTGASPQLTAMQDVMGPARAFQKLSGEGSDLLQRFHADLPDFWTEKRGTFRLFANDPNSNWTSLEQHLGIARAALNGDEPAKSYCLKSADTFIRLAHETGHRFQHFTDFNYPDQKELIPLDNEYGGCFLLYMMQCYALSPEKRFLEEAKQAAAKIADWDFNTSRMAAWTGAVCEGLGRLYAATGDKQYLRISLIPLAGLIRNAWLWNCRYGWAGGYTTFWGFNSDASGVDYITPSDQHWVWAALWDYYLRTHEALPPSARLLVAELLRYAPQVGWYTYPPNLPPKSLHKGKGFWNTDNHFELYLPVEDVNDGWRDNGMVGQMLYGAGAAFDFASLAYTRLPEVGALLYCELPLLETKWDAQKKTLLVRIGGEPRFPCKLEVRPDPTSHMTWRVDDLKMETAPPDRPQAFRPLPTQVEDGTVRGEAPGGVWIRINAPSP